MLSRPFFAHRLRHSVLSLSPSKTDGARRAIAARGTPGRLGPARVAPPLPSGAESLGDFSGHSLSSG